jgi:hypothetical protein
VPTPPIVLGGRLYATIAIVEVRRLSPGMTYAYQLTVRGKQGAGENVIVSGLDIPYLR